MVKSNLAYKAQDTVVPEVVVNESPIKWCAVALSDVIARGKRLEASVFDVEAKQARSLIAKGKYTQSFIGGASGMASSYVCGRFKRIWVEKSDMPIYQPSSIVDIKPTPDGYISAKTKTNIGNLRVKENQILMTCSGTIGKVSFVSRTLANKIFSHDLLRIDCRKPDEAGYYKCVSVKKKRTECHKKPVRKEWIEDLVVGETMKMVMDDKAIEAIVSMLMDLQDRDNVNVPLYEQQLREAETAISNLLNAIQQGILTRSTKERLEELENRRDELENRLACEKLAKPKVSAEFMTFWLHRFRKLDVRQQSHRKMLIDTFINAIFLYDDKMVITFNYKEGTKTITFAELQEAISNNNGSDLDCIAAPY